MTLLLAWSSLVTLKEDAKKICELIPNLSALTSSPDSDTGSKGLLAEHETVVAPLGS